MAIDFYNAADNKIYDSGIKFRPQERFTSGSYEIPTPTPTPVIPGGGITNTNAFMYSGGGNGFNQSGNAFGYGSPVQEVNMRTFNPKELPGAMTPGGQNANTVYNQAFKDLNNPSLKGMSNDFVGKRAQDVMDYANESIMDYRQNYGAQGQYNSPYDDTVDLGYMGRDTSTSLDGTVNKDAKGNYIGRTQNTLGRALDFAIGLIPGVGAVKRGAKYLRGKFPNPNGPGGGTYGVAGLSNAQKEQYNSLANQGMLYDGSSGMKTLTGKNFTGKGYMEGQIELAKGFGFDTMTEEEIEAEIAKTKANPRQQFKYKQMKESSQMFKTNEKQKQKQKEEFNKPGGTGEQVANIQARVDKQYQDQMNKDGKDFSVSGPDTSSNPKGKSNQASSERGYQMHGADGGRAGYFFGGRVSFKNGGLASIL